MKNRLRRDGTSHDTTPLGDTPIPDNTGPVMNKRSVDKTLQIRNVRPQIRAKELPLYYGKNIKEHQNWTLDARNTFLFSPDDFPREQDKVIYAMQYLAGEPKETWFQNKTRDYSTVTWEGFAKFLLDIIEDPVNRQLHIAQMYTDAVQLPNQSVHAFDSYLGTLEAQLPPYSEDHMRTHFFTKLRPDIRAALTMYQDLPTTQSNLVALAARLESNLRKGNAAKPKANPSSNAHAGSKSGLSTKSAEDKDHKPAEGKAKGKRDSKKGGKQSKTPPSGDKSHITCFNCDQKGHYSPECPLPKKDSNPNKTPVAAVSTSKNSRAPGDTPCCRSSN